MLYNPPVPRSLSDYAKLMDGIRGTANDSIVLVRIDDSALYTDATVRQTLDVLHMDGMFNYGFYGKANYQRPLPQSDDYILMFSVAPGFDNSRAAGIRNPVMIGRNNGITYDDGWSTLIDRRPEWIAVISFNEWHETSQIEPARPFSYGGFKYLDYEGHYGAHGADALYVYLARTAMWADRFKGKSGAPTISSQLPVTGTQRPVTSPSQTSTSSAQRNSSPGPTPGQIVSLELVVILVGIVISAAVVLWRRRR
jgi:hypothetical protein